MTKISKITSTAAALGTMLTVLPGAALAQTNISLNLPAGSQFQNVAAWTPTRVIAAAVNLILVGAGIIAFFFLLLGGLQWIMAGGDKEGTEKARKRITAALIGLALIFSVYAIVFLMAAFLGVDLFNFSIKNI